jgi:hypothetical protein
MNIHQILREHNNQYLYEGLTYSEKRSVMLWESAGYAIKEAALTTDQIQQLFTSIEQGATASGSNRTLLGKGKDVAGAVKTAYDDLVSKVQNSGPVKNIDAKYDQAAEKLKQATGGDQGVMKYVEKYRKFAKEHPVAQGLIYSALIAAAGISGVGVGGAAALGLLKMTDKLLQGEKFSTAVGKGAATGALAYGAGQIGQAIKGADQVADVPLSGAGDWIAKDPRFADTISNILNSPDKSDAWKAAFTKSLEFNARALDPASSAPGSISRAIQTATKIASLKAESIQYNSKKLSEGQVYLVFNRICATQLDEGVFDRVKNVASKAAGAVVNKAKTIGQNLTTKVTADKLNSAWQKAGSPTDSEELKKFLIAQGVDTATVDSVYTSLKIPSSTATAAEPETTPADEPTTSAASEPVAPLKSAASSNDNSSTSTSSSPLSGVNLNTLKSAIARIVDQQPVSNQERSSLQRFLKNLPAEA